MNNKSQYILEVKDVSKSYGNSQVLKEISLTIKKGLIYGILGINGAGKSTLLRIINQIIAPDVGSLVFNGKRLSRNDISCIGYLPEERGLFNNMKVGQQLIYFAQLKGLSKKEAELNAKYWTNELEVNSWWDKELGSLSKGMQQKVQFITSVVHDPILLIMDEPFSGLDPANVELMTNEILKLKEKGIAIVLSTHDMNSVDEFCDEISIIHNSEIIVQGIVSEIKKKYNSNLYELRLYAKELPFSFNEFKDLKIYESKIDKGELTIKFAMDKKNDFKVMMSKIECLDNNVFKSFSSIIPSMKDIFLNSTSKKYDYE